MLSWHTFFLSFDFCFRHVCCGLSEARQSKLLVLWSEGRKYAPEQRWLLSWGGLFPIWISVQISCKFQAAPLKHSRSLLGAGGRALCCVFCFHPHQSIPNRSACINQLSFFLENYWDLGARSKMCLAWNARRLQPGYCLSFKSSKQFLGQGGKGAVSGGTQSRTQLAQRSVAELDQDR